MGESQLHGKEGKQELQLTGDGQRGKTAGWGSGVQGCRCGHKVRVFHVVWRLQDEISFGEKKGRKGVLLRAGCQQGTVESPLSLREISAGVLEGTIDRAVRGLSGEQVRRENVGASWTKRK